jgi:hypothetical protein
MTSDTLLWIHHDEDLARRNKHEFSSHVRQHVMVNYHTKKAKQVQGTQAAGKPKPSPSQIKHIAIRPGQTALSPITVCSTKAKQSPRHVAYYPPPAPGLINDEQRSVYSAVWWHRYHAPGLRDQERLDWQEKCRMYASEILWNVAKSDKTFFEIFMCLSAAKEIVVKESGDTHAYYRHKGKAISLLSQDVNRKSVQPVANSELLIAIQVKVHR